MLCASKVAERQHRDARIDVEAPHFLRRKDRNIRKLLCRRIEIHRRIGDELDVVLEDQHIETGRDRCAGLGLNDLQCRPDRVRIMLRQPRHQTVCVAVVEHHHAELDRPPHLVLCPRFRHPFPLAQVVIPFRKPLIFRGMDRVDDGQSLEGQIKLRDLLTDNFLVSQHDRQCDLFIEDDLARPQDLVLRPFGEDNPFRSPLGLVDEHPHYLL